MTPCTQTPHTSGSRLPARPLQLPDPNTIRPLEVLKQTLELIKRKWREEGNYGYICDQFKSMRQDLIVRVPLSSLMFALSLIWLCRVRFNASQTTLRCRCTRSMRG